MDNLYQETLKKIEARFPLEKMVLPPELERIRYPFKLLDLQCRNWRSQKIRKLYSMQIKIPLFSMDMLGISIYPAPGYDLPIFIFDLTNLKKKMVAYINFMPLLPNADYLKKYMDPLQEVSKKYSHLPPREMPEWMRTYQRPGTIYSMPERRLEKDVKDCAKDYLDLYLEMLDQAKETSDKAYAEKIRDAQASYRSDIITKDRSRKMLAKLIGSKKADRLFQEVLV